MLSHREHRSAGIFYKVDVFHFHWINAYLNHKPLKAFISTFAFIMFILILKLRGTKIIWTLHNSVEFTHHGKNKWLENILVPFLLNKVDKIIIHSKFQKNHLDKKYHNKLVWIPHQNYCSLLDKNIENNKEYFLFFGGINRYKNIEFAIATYKKALKNKDIDNFIIAGIAPNLEYNSELIKLIDNNKKLVFKNKQLSDEELEQIVKKAKAVILPFDEITNSGSMIYALSCKTKVIMQKSQLTDEFLNNYDNLENAILTYSNEDELKNILLSIDNNNVDYKIFDDYIEKTNISNLVDKYIKVFET